MKLRDYQQDAVSKTLDALITKPSSSSLIVAPTGCGKSVMIAAIIKEYLANKPTARILVLCHQAEILIQNEAMLFKFNVQDVGMACAQLRRKEWNSKVLLCSRATALSGIRRKELDTFDLAIFDEAHLVSIDEDSGYQRIIAHINPSHIVGLTGTPWRLDNGLIYGVGKQFDSCVYQLGMNELFNAQMLSPYQYVSHTVIDASKLPPTGGDDFTISALDSLSLNKVEQCIDKWEELKQGRKLTLMFCNSLQHAKVTHSILTKRGFKAESIVGEMKGIHRKGLIDDARDGKIDVLISVGCLTTGVDIPLIDCIVLMRATQSASLYVQMVGRGLRLSPGKKDTLIIDLTDNHDRFNSIENPLVFSQGMPLNKKAVSQLLEGWVPDDFKAPTNSAATKQCPSCKAKNPVAAKYCSTCSELFLSLKTTQKQVDIYELDGQPTQLRTVSRSGEPMIVVTYKTTCGERFTQYLMPKSRHIWLVLEYHKVIRTLKNNAVTKIKVTQKDKFPKIEVVG